MRRFVPFIGILFVIAAVLRIDFFFTIAYLFFGVYLLSRLWMQRATKQLSVERRFADHAFFGDRVAVDLRLRNTGWLPIPWLYVHDSLPVQLAAPPFFRRVVGLGPHQSKDLNYELECHKRGYYAVGPTAVQSGDLLDVAHPQPGQVDAVNLVVYPKIVPIEKLGLPTHSPLAVLPARSPLFRDPTCVIGVRDYQWGDSPRRIHWTATASAGRLLVKRYRPAIARETLICLDLDQQNYGQRQRYDATELAIVVAASLANHIIVKEGLPVGLTTQAWDPLVEQQVHIFRPPRSQRASLITLLEVLARVQITSETSLSNLLRRATMSLSWGSTLCVITGRETTDLLDNLVYLRRAGFAISLILVQPALPSPELRKRADSLRVPVYRIWTEADLGAWR